MSMHHDNRGLYDKHGRLFFKYGGYFAREGDAYLPAFHDKHDSFWVRPRGTSKAI